LNYLNYFLFFTVFFHQIDWQTNIYCHLMSLINIQFFWKQMTYPHQDLSSSYKLRRAKWCSSNLSNNKMAHSPKWSKLEGDFYVPLNTKKLNQLGHKRKWIINYLFFVEFWWKLVATGRGKWWKVSGFIQIVFLSWKSSSFIQCLNKIYFILFLFPSKKFIE